MTVTIRYFAAARAAAGVKAETLELPGECALEQLLAVISERHGQRLSRVLYGCSFFLNETSVPRRKARVTPDCVLDVLPPFAGG
jgi:sulfur-carrier protein